MDRLGLSPARKKESVPDPGRPVERGLAPIANHASTRTTQLYGRRRDEVRLEEVERIVI